MAKLSGPKNCIPASSDILTNDANRIDPLVIEQISKEWSPNVNILEATLAFHWDIVKLEKNHY